MPSNNIALRQQLHEVVQSGGDYLDFAERQIFLECFKARVEYSVMPAQRKCSKSRNFSATHYSD